VLADLRDRFGLEPDDHQSGGPARYWRLTGTDTRLGLISPLTGNFCATCNRVRLSTDGKLHMCLGHEDSVDLREAIRSLRVAMAAHESLRTGEAVQLSDV